MHPSLRIRALPVSSRPETGQWATTFDYCRGKCRTSSNSTVHENAYLMQDRYCFSALGASLLPILCEAIICELTIPSAMSLKLCISQQANHTQWRRHLLHCRQMWKLSLGSRLRAVQLPVREVSAHAQALTSLRSMDATSCASASGVKLVAVCDLIRRQFRDTQPALQTGASSRLSAGSASLAAQGW